MSFDVTLQVDHRFFWNAYIQKDFIQNKLDKWILPVMDGYILK
jgi:hypothetical protein